MGFHTIGVKSHHGCATNLVGYAHLIFYSVGLQIKGVISQDDGYGIEFFIGINKNSVGPSNSLILYITTASVDPVKFHVERIDSILHSGRVMLDKAEAVYLDSYYMVNTSSYADRTLQKLIC